MPFIETKTNVTVSKEVEERINKGLSTLEFYDGLENGAKIEGTYTLNSNESRIFGENAHAFSATLDEEFLTLTVNAKTKEPCIVCYEFEPLVPSPTLTFSTDGKIDFVSEVYSHHSMFGDKIDKEKAKYSLSVKETEDGATYTLKAKRAAVGYTDDKPLRLRLSVGADLVKPSKIKLRFLAKWSEYPDTFIWLKK